MFISLLFFTELYAALGAGVLNIHITVIFTEIYAALSQGRSTPYSILNKTNMYINNVLCDYLETESRSGPNRLLLNNINFNI